MFRFCANIFKILANILKADAIFSFVLWFPEFLSEPPRSGPPLGRWVKDPLAQKIQRDGVVVNTVVLIEGGFAITARPHALSVLSLWSQFWVKLWVAGLVGLTCFVCFVLLCLFSQSKNGFPKQKKTAQEVRQYKQIQIKQKLSTNPPFGTPGKTPCLVFGATSKNPNL